MMCSGKVFLEGGWKLVDNDLRSDGEKLLDLDMKLSTVFILCGIWLLVMIFVGYNKYRYEGGGRIRTRAGYEDNFATKGCAVGFAFLLGFFSLRPMLRAMHTALGVPNEVTFWPILLLYVFWMAYAFLALGFGYFGTILKHVKVAKKKRIYNIQKTLERLDVKY